MSESAVKNDEERTGRGEGSHAHERSDMACHGLCGGKQAEQGNGVSLGCLFSVQPSGGGPSAFRSLNSCGSLGHGRGTKSERTQRLLGAQAVSSCVVHLIGFVLNKKTVEGATALLGRWVMEGKRREPAGPSLCPVLHVCRGERARERGEKWNQQING